MQVDTLRKYMASAVPTLRDERFCSGRTFVICARGAKCIRSELFPQAREKEANLSGPGDEIAELFEVSSPHAALWAGTFNVEYCLAATVLQHCIVQLSPERFARAYREKLLPASVLVKRKLLATRREELFINSVSAPLSEKSPSEFPFLFLFYDGVNHLMALHPPLYYPTSQYNRRCNFVCTLDIDSLKWST